MPKPPRTNGSLVVPRVPRESEPGCEVVLICGKRVAAIVQFVTQAVVERQVGTQVPAVLSRKRRRKGRCLQSSGHRIRSGRTGARPRSNAWRAVMGAAPRAGLTRAPGSVPNPNRPPKNVWDSNSPPRIRTTAPNLNRCFPRERIRLSAASYRRSVLKEGRKISRLKKPKPVMLNSGPLGSFGIDIVVAVIPLKTRFVHQARTEDTGPARDCVTVESMNVVRPRKAQQRARALVPLVGVGVVVAQEQLVTGAGAVVDSHREGFRVCGERENAAVGPEQVDGALLAGQSPA